MKLFFSGDIVLRHPIHEMLLTEELKNIVDQHDVVCCNLEAPIESKKAAAATKKGPVYGQSQQILQTLYQSGFQLFLLANNHIMDRGKAGLLHTMNSIGHLEGAEYIGAGLTEQEVYSYKLFKNQDVTVALFNVAEAGFGCCTDKSEAGYAWFDHLNFYENLAEARQVADYVIICCHAGAEELKVPLPFFRSLYRRFIALGVDIVIGTHPHVIQGMEKYRNGMIFYSLGNFAFDLPAPGGKGYRPYIPEGIALSISLCRDKPISYRVVPTRYTGDKVMYSADTIKLFEERISLLQNEKNYQHVVANFCGKMYLTVYRSYYENILGLGGLNWKEKLRTIILFLKGRMKIDNDWLYHNIAIETHRTVCMEAIKNNCVDKEEEKNVFWRKDKGYQ